MHAPTSDHSQPTFGHAVASIPETGWQGEEWRMHLHGMQALAQLAQGRRGEEGMRRHYLALMRACSESMTQLMAAAPRAAAESSRS
jgi:hypothetical protein